MSAIEDGPRIAREMGLDRQTSTVRASAIGFLMRAYRRANHRTMGDVSLALGCSVSRVSDIEHGYVEPTDDELARFTGTRW